MKSIFWKIYIFCIPVNRLLWLPGLGAKLQLPELAFLPWLLSSAKDIRFGLKQRRWFISDIAVLSWPVVMFLPVVAGGWSVNLLMEITGAGYLALVYFLIRWNRSPGFPEKAVQILVLSGVISAVAGIAGWLLKLIGIENPLVISRYYPYLGHVLQLKGFANSPNMLAGFLMVSILLQTGRMWNKRNRTTLQWIMVFILGIGFLLTLSKAIVPLFAGIYFIIAVLQSRQKKCRLLCKPAGIAIAILMVSVFYLAATHFYITRTDRQQQIEEFKPENYRYAGAVFHFHFAKNDYVLIPTNYLISKKAALQAFNRSGGWGVGGGNFNRFVADLKNEGMYPRHLPNYAPHSSVTGSLAEHGLAGFLVFMFFAFAMAFVARKNLKNEGSGLAISIAAALIAIAVSSLATDIMNFRHYWWVFALNAALYNSRPADASL